MLGIDFGTVNTVAALRHADGRTEMLVFNGSPLLPSAVHFGPAGQFLTGRDAQHAAQVRPEGCEPHPKRRIDDGTVVLGGRELPVTHLVAAVLARVMDEARRIAGEEPGHVVLTYPATWHQPRQEVLEQAAVLAGVPVPVLVPAPVAAAASFLTLTRIPLDDGRGVVVYDVGSGTLDATVVRRTAGRLAVAAAEHVADPDGPDIDPTVSATDTAVRAAGLPPAGIAGIFLVGDVRRMPLAAPLLHQRFGIAPTVAANPEFVVAQGAVAVDLLSPTAPGPENPAGTPVPGQVPHAYPAKPSGLGAPGFRPPSSRRTTAAWTAAVLAATTVVVVLVSVLIVQFAGDDGGTADAAGTPSATEATTTARSRVPASGPTNCTYLAADDSNGRVKEVGRPPATDVPTTGTRTATMVTSLGTIEFTIDRTAAPCTANSFAYLAGKRFYDRTSCHRLVTQTIYVLQCGDPFGDSTGGPSYRYGTENLPTDRESRYPAGTVAMATTTEPNSVGSQFFIVYQGFDDALLDPLYTVVGTVTKGLDLILEAAEAGVVEPGAFGPGDGKPKRPVDVTSLRVA
ncbi:hypothetical protein GCM10020369_67160 [Cryptosporangium minutisporangium]|uniref:PPIase cyclophilin-type domain-containing protein n=1 Tax=Cryptosporangium minutisporangium TaxID=113569 RepID=A0ABP6T7F3_9ACTN